MGGEKNKELEGVWLPMGSPPRGRGKVLYRVPEVVPVSPPHRRGKAYEQLQSGITPAQAGKRRQSSHCLRPDRDHPRAGGEKFSSLTLFGL